jgi:hypothetical protein
LASVENAITRMPRERATCATGATVSANSGPRMISAPSSSACCAACWAPGALPASSFTSSWMSGLLNSAIAISAALRIDCAATAALPLADNGRIRPTLTLPSPIFADDCGGVAGCEPGSRSPTEKLPEHPASRNADARAANQGDDRRAGAKVHACSTRDIQGASLDGVRHYSGQSAGAISHFLP